MKKIITLAASFFISSVFSGGISVGSGQGKIIVGLSLDSGFTEEAQLMHNAESLIAQISNGANRKINHMINSGSCSKTYSRVDELDVTTYFPVDKNGLALQKQHVGFLTVELNDCTRPSKINSELRFGWAELWE
jgi:hypothetical protein